MTFIRMNSNDRMEQLKGLLIKIMEKNASSKDRKPVKVDEGLYIGSIGAAYNREGLLEEGITHVICAARHIQLK